MSPHNNLVKSPINSGQSNKLWSTRLTLKPKRSPQESGGSDQKNEDAVISSLSQPSGVKAVVKRFIRLSPKISPKDSKAEDNVPPPIAQLLSQDSVEEFARYSCINPAHILTKATSSVVKHNCSPISTLDNTPFTFQTDVITPVLLLSPSPQDHPILKSPKPYPSRKKSFKPPALEIEEVDLSSEFDMEEEEEEEEAALTFTKFIASCNKPLPKSPSLQTFHGSYAEDIGPHLLSMKRATPKRSTALPKHPPITPSSCPSVQPPPTRASHQPRYGPQSARAAEEDGEGENKFSNRRAISIDSADVSHVVCNEYVDINQYFRFREEIGSGAWGTVRRCIDMATGRQLACKTIPKSKLKCELDVRDLKAEVNTLTAMQGHPGIVTLEGVFEDARHVHFIMEYCDGGELFHRIKELEHFEEAEAAQICATLVSVLEHCHKNNVMHRDLKPENILLASKNSNTDVRVADFGSATFFNPDKKLKLVVGSPLYMAPSVLESSYGPEADMWSLGVILYILLCGYPPFWGPTNSAIFKSIQEDELDLSSMQWQFVSCAAKDLVRGLLRKDPRKRMSYSEVHCHPWIQHFSLKQRVEHLTPVDSTLAYPVEKKNRLVDSPHHVRRHSLSSIY